MIGWFVPIGNINIVIKIPVFIVLVGVMPLLSMTIVLNKEKSLLFAENEMLKKANRQWKKDFNKKENESAEYKLRLTQVSTILNIAAMDTNKTKISAISKAYDAMLTTLDERLVHYNKLVEEKYKDE